MKNDDPDIRSIRGAHVFLRRPWCCRILVFLCACLAAPPVRATVTVTAGRPYEGTAQYASGGMRELDRFDLPLDEDHIACGVLDSAAGRAWFGADSGEREARIYKVRLEPGTAAPRLIATLSLGVRHLTFTKAMIDPGAGYGYFTGETTEGASYLFKIALGAGDAPPRLAASLTLAMSEIRSGVIDPIRGHACLGGRAGDRGVIAKVALGQGEAPPRLVAIVPIPNDEWGPRCSAIDPASGQVWLGIRSVPPHIAKYDPGVGEAAPVRLGAVEIPTELGRLSSFVIDRQARYGYIGTQVYDASGWIIKVDLGAGGNPPEMVGAVQLDAEDGSILRNSGVLAAGGRHALFCTESSPPRVLKVALGEGAAPPAPIGRVALAPEERPVTCLLADEASGMTYLGTNTNPSAYVVKVDCGGEHLPPRRLTRLTLPGGERDPRCVLVDTQRGYAYYGTAASPARIIKVRLGGAVRPPQRLGSLVLEQGENDALCGLIDPDAGLAWFGLGTAPGRIVKVALGSGDALPARLGALTLQNGEDFPSCAVLDAARQTALWGTATTPGAVVKTSLGQGTALPARVGVLRLTAGSNDLKCAVADPMAGLAWFGTGTFPGRVVKIGFGPAGAPPERLAAIELPAGPDGPEGDLHTAFIDNATGYGWFKGYQGAIAINTLIKVALGGATDPPQRLGSIQYSVDYSTPWESGAVKGYFNKNGYAMGGYPGSFYVVRTSLGQGDDPPESYNRLALTDPNGVRCAAIDPSFDDGYFGDTRIRLSGRNLIVASRVAMPEAGCVTTVSAYAHIPEGNLRLALYANTTTPTLLWQSPRPIPIAREGWIGVPLDGGDGQGLVLPAGDLWLAWQVDTRQPTIGTFGKIDKGFYIKFPNGPFPAKLPPVGAGDCRASAQVFSGALSYAVPEINFQAGLIPTPSRGVPLAVDVVLSDAPRTTVTAKIKIGGSAKRGSDYLFTFTEVKFLPGQTRQTFPYIVFEKAPEGGDKFISLTLADPVSARVGGGGVWLHTITRNDPPGRPVASLRGSPAVVEGDYSWAWFTVELDGIGLAGPVEADLETVECGEAAAGADFVPLKQHVTLPAGARSASFVVGVLNDALPEPPERFQVRMTNLKGASPGVTLATATILDRAPGGVIPYLLGVEKDAAGLDLNGDGQVTIADELHRATRLAPGPFDALLPAEGNANVPGPVFFDWTDAARADDYDLYVWPAGAPQPRAPFKTGLRASRLEDAPATLQYNTDYLWQAVARNDNGMTAGPPRGFRTSPALMELVAPTSGTLWTRGAAVAVHWRVNTRMTGDAVIFELWRGGRRAAALGGDYNKGGDAVKTLRVPAELAPAADYRLRLVSDWLARTGHTPAWIEIPIALK